MWSILLFSFLSHNKTKNKTETQNSEVGTLKINLCTFSLIISNSLFGGK